MTFKDRQINLEEMILINFTGEKNTFDDITREIELLLEEHQEFILNSLKSPTTQNMKESKE